MTRDCRTLSVCKGRVLIADTPHSEECLRSANENLIHEESGRVPPSHPILSQLQHAFVQTQESESVLGRGALWCNSWNVSKKRWQLQCGSYKVRTTPCCCFFLTRSPIFGKLPNFFLSFFLFCFVFCLSRSREVVDAGTARCRERINGSPGGGGGFFFFQCWVLLKHDCCHVQSVDILHVPWQKGEVTLMLPFVLLAGYLWRGSSVCFHAAVGVSCGGQGSTVSAGFIDLDSRRRHT